MEPGNLLHFYLTAPQLPLLVWGPHIEKHCFRQNDDALTCSKKLQNPLYLSQIDT